MHRFVSTNCRNELKLYGFEHLETVFYSYVNPLSDSVVVAPHMDGIQDRAFITVEIPKNRVILDETFFSLLSIKENN